MGPEGGSGGGTVVTQGTPEDVAGSPGSHTGTFLSGLLKSPVGKPATRRRKASA
jgi:excinuclease ABC subunit A